MSRTTLSRVRGFEERQHPGRVGGWGLPQEEEPEIERQDRPGEQRADAAQDAGARRDRLFPDQGEPLEQGRLLAQHEVPDLLSHRVVFEEVHERRGLGDHPGIGVFKKGRRPLHQIAKLGREQAPEDEREAGEDRRHRHVHRDERRPGGQPQAGPEGVEPRLEDQRGQTAHREGEQHVGERGHEPVEEPDDAADGAENDHGGEDDQRGRPRISGTGRFRAPGRSAPSSISVLS